MNDMSYWVYILHCDNDSYYTGYTNDLSRRYLSHLNGTGRCKYTRSFKPLGIAQCWRILGNKADAMSVERQIKKLSRLDKEKLISRPSKLSTEKNIKVVSKRVRDKIISGNNK